MVKIKKIIDFIIWDFLWTINHSAKIDFIFNVILLILQIITLIFVLKIYNLLRQ
jgi:hypothetical protein